MKHLFLLLVLLISACTSDETTTVDLSEHRGFEALGESVKEDIFLLNIGGEQIDEFHRLNPKLFPLVKLSETKNDDVLIKSSKTNKIYRASFKKGDIIYLPIRY